MQLPWHVVLSHPKAVAQHPFPAPMQTEGWQRLHRAHFSKPQSLGTRQTEAPLHAEARDPGKEKPEPRGVQ